MTIGYDEGCCPPGGCFHFNPLMQEINQIGGYNDEIEGKLKGILDSFKATQSW